MAKKWTKCDEDHEIIIFIEDDCPLCNHVCADDNLVFDFSGVIDYFQDSTYTTEKQEHANGVLDVLSEFL